MLSRISEFIMLNPGTKARMIASQLKEDRGEVNRLLYEQSGKMFKQDSEFRWFLAQSTCRVEFGGRTWLVARDFENALLGISPFGSDHTLVIFVLKDEVKPMLDFLGRLLALCNQLVASGKAVTLDFESSPKTLSYLNRVGFFGVLDQNITVLPSRPNGSLAKTYRGNNVGVIEFRAINPKLPDNDIPTLLQQSFISCAGASYSQAAFIMLAELFGNVLEHSGTVSPGFACLQFYRKSRKIQTVISDNGHGIVGTLSPVVPKKYPDVHRAMLEANHPGVALLTEVFRRGSLSQVDEDGRGLGIWRSGDIAEKYSAKISVRQSDFELRVHHDHNGVQFSHRVGLAPMLGTHICFEFKLDDSVKAA